jgi:aldehyde:ferredoxin oxidoreductase
MINHRRILDVDLSRRSRTYRPYPESAVERGLWGRGFNVCHLLQAFPAPVDPLGPDNVLIFSCGLLTGTAAATASRLHISALSPLTGLLGSSNIGGYFAECLSACRIQSLIIHGRSDRPVILWITADAVCIEDAADLWGLDTVACQTRIRARLNDPNLKILTIGPAGENRVPYAAILSDLDHCAGRTGMGAVMGAKRLKAVVVSKPRFVRWPRASSQLFDANRRYLHRITAATEFKFFKNYGGAGYLEWANDLGIMATRNYRRNRFEHLAAIDGRKLKNRVVSSRGCPRCPIQCKARLRMQPGRWFHDPATRPEFESMLNLGPKCGLSDLDALVYFDNLCNRLGLDTISAGTVIAFAMDMFEQGLLKPADTGGLRLHWGDARIMHILLGQIAHREGVGRLLSLGVRKAAEQLGGNAGAHAAHVKGLELSGYHPSHILGAALGYAVSNRGGDFNGTYSSLEYRWAPKKARRFFGSVQAVDIHAVQGKGPLIRQSMITSIMLDCLGLCKVPALSLMEDFLMQQAAELASACCAASFSGEALFNTGRAIADMERRFNLRMHPTAGSDTLPPMLLDQPGGHLSSEGLHQMRRDFYSTMGWDAAGRPPCTGLADLFKSDVQKGA